MEEISTLVLDKSRIQTAFALHIGGLPLRYRSEVVAAYAGADVVYADGVSISVISRLTNGFWIERSATTDIGVPVLSCAAEKLGRPTRIALIGGPEGLAARAGAALETQLQVSVVMAAHGFHTDWSEVMTALHSTAPDIVLVGMGCPEEMLWVDQHRDALPAALYLTCGGWFGFLTGNERRAPAAAQHLGLEWIFRIAHDPRGKAGRYVRGVGDVIGCIREGRSRGRRDID